MSATPESYPSPDQLLPHTGAMVLLSRVVSHDGDGTQCELDVDDLRHFRDDAGRVGAWVGLELMAQCVGVHAGMTDHEAGEPPRIGLLLGGRRIRLHTDHFEAGQTLSIRAQHVWGDRVGLVVFDCSIEDRNDGRSLADGRLSCYVPAEGEVLGDGVLEIGGAAGRGAGKDS